PPCAFGRRPADDLGETVRVRLDGEARVVAALDCDDPRRPLELGRRRGGCVGEGGDDGAVAPSLVHDQEDPALETGKSPLTDPSRLAGPPLQLVRRGMRGGVYGPGQGPPSG